MIPNNTTDPGTITNGHNTLVNGVHTYIHATNARLAKLEQLTAEQGLMLVTMRSEMAVQKTAQASTEASLRTENEALKLELTDLKSRFHTQKRESDTEIRQLQSSLQNLALANREVLEQVTQLNSRSFFDSTRAPTEVGDDDINLE